MFSLLTQFTEKSYGTDTKGNFVSVPVPEKSRIFIGNNVPDKIFRGTVIWFFHLVNDLAGSSSTAGISGGTGIPGPILSIAKELSVLPLFKSAKIGNDSASIFLSKLFNGTLLAKHDADGKIIKETVVKFDLRGELGGIVEIGKQTLPVIANECIVRVFYFVRRFALEIKTCNINSINEISFSDWNKVRPCKNPTLDRMLTISTGVFTVIDVAGVAVSKKYWVSVNYVGVGRFTVAVGQETINFLKTRNRAKIKQMYQEIERNTYLQTDDRIYGRLSEGMNLDKLGLTIQQTEILYNLEHYKTLNDIDITAVPVGKEKFIFLKQEWLDEWKSYMESGFSDFVKDQNTKLHWYTKEELIEKVRADEPTKPWLRQVLLESMIFEPYFPLSIEKDKKGNDIPSKKYDSLNAPIVGYRNNFSESQ